MQVKQITMKDFTLNPELERRLAEIDRAESAKKESLAERQIINGDIDIENTLLSLLDQKDKWEPQDNNKNVYVYKGSLLKIKIGSHSASFISPQELVISRTAEVFSKIKAINNYRANTADKNAIEKISKLMKEL